MRNPPGFVQIFRDGGDNGGSSSSSSSAQTDNRVGASDNAVAVGAGGSYTWVYQNPEGFKELLKQGGALFEGALEFAQDNAERAGVVYEKALNAVTASGDKALNAVQAASNSALAAVQTSNNTESQNLGLQVLKQAGPILLVLGLGYAMMKGK